MATVIFQEGTDAYSGCIDTRLIDGALADNNYGSEDGMDIGENAAYKRNYVIRFDISTIPTNAIVSAATFALKSSGISKDGDTFSLYKADTYQFTELGATWNKYDGSNTWDTGGGDYAGAAEQAMSVGATENTWYTFGSGDELNTLVQGWVSNPATNLGLFLIDTGDPADSVAKILTREDGTTADRPKLSVTYTVAGGGLLMLRANKQANIGVLTRGNKQ